MKKTEVLGSPVTIGTFNQYIQSAIGKTGYSCFLNVHMFHEHFKNPEFRNVLNDASFVLPDGMPIVYSLKKFYGIEQQRIAGNDVIFSLIQKAKDESLKVYLIGSTNDVLSTISEDLSSKEIEHQSYSPPFLAIDEFDFEAQAEMINQFQPDIVLVGLGCPKQEIWMNRMDDKISAPMFGLGGAFQLYAGIDSRAPKWMRNVGLEWFYRLLLEPGRLLKRYLVTNSYFVIVFLKYLLFRR